MAREPLNCWHCGASLASIPLPIGRREECRECGESLHVCRMCTFYDPKASKACREPMADEVAEKEQANFCDYFRPQPNLTGAADPDAAAARERLSALFGEDRPTGKAAGTGKAAATAARAAPQDGPQEDSEAEAARRKLEAIFGKTEH